MLHIHNGESSANTLKQSAIPGEQFAFRESLITGPNPAGVAADDWRRLRAKHLSDAYGVQREECERDLQHQDEVLSSTAGHDEIVLWFEHDLFCQLHLAYLLHWFGSHAPGETNLSLICIGEFPGIENFRGLGQLNVEQLTSLFGTRQRVTDGELKLGAAAWRSYCAPEPTFVEALLELDTSSLPFLREALLAHLARFPSVRNGLGNIENHALALVDKGLENFGELFSQFGKEDPVYSLGDFQFWLALKQMALAQRPLLVFANGQSIQDPIDSARVRETRVALTSEGKAVLQGEADFLNLNGIDQWLGGVHLEPERVWRWDEDEQRLYRF